MTAARACRMCGTEPLANARFCHGCGSPVVEAETHAEYKQVTVLFADVVRSMAIAAALDVERYREIMTELVERSAASVRHYGGTVDFTGDGVMAVFGAPAALEDHAVRACLAALAIQEETNRLAAVVQRRDGVALRVRVGLNSGRVIAGEIGSGSLGYAAIGEQMGMAQRMESVAPPGGVMLSASTARLVDGAAALGEPEMVRIKGADEPVMARRLVAAGARPAQMGLSAPLWLDVRWELNTVASPVGSVHQRPWVRRGCDGTAGHRQEPSCLRGDRHWRAAAVRRCSSTFCESHTSRYRVSCGGAAAARGHRRRGSVTHRPPVTECAPGFPTPTPRTWCYLMTCWASPIPMSLRRDRSGCAAAAVDRADQCRLAGPH